MIKPSVYLDATIPSFYFEERESVIMRAWRALTIRFWDEARARYDLYLSDETMRELEDLRYPEEKRRRCIELVNAVPRLDLTDEVINLADLYVRERVMPSNDLGDAFHLAFATTYRIQYLLTWNCKHLANANKFEHIQAVNGTRRLVSPMIVTPAQLLEVET